MYYDSYYEKERDRNRRNSEKKLREMGYHQNSLGEYVRNPLLDPKYVIDRRGYIKKPDGFF